MSYVQSLCVTAVRNARQHRCAMLGVLMLLAGCASTPEANLERDAEAKRFEPVTRDSVIYIYRPDVPNRHPAATLWADGRLLGDALPGTYFRVIVFAGRTVLHTSGPDAGRLELTTLGNDIAYVEMRTTSAESTSFRLMPVDEAQPAIRACCTMLELWRPGQPRLFW